MSVQIAGNILVQSNGDPLPIAMGGTGQTTASAAINALLPSQAGNSNKVLKTDGTNVSWVLASGAAGGSDTQIQYNDSGNFAGSSNFTINKSTGAITAASTVTTLGAVINGAAATVRPVKYQSAASDRWFLQVNSTAESGAAAGSNFEIVRLADNGSTQNVVLDISRATGVVDFKVAPTVNGSAITGGVTTFSAGTTGFTPSSATTGAVTLAGTLNVANGGTGASTANTAFNNLVPSQVTNSGKFLTTDGTDTSWATVSASPGGSTTQIQYNSSGSFAGSSSFTYNGTSGVTLGNGTTAGSLTFASTSGDTTAVIKVAETTGGKGHLTVAAGDAQASGSQGGGNLTLKSGAPGANTGGGGNAGSNVFISAGAGGGSLPTGGYITLSTATTDTLTERFRILANGAWSVGSNGTSYGTSGQVLTSNGNAAPTWQSAATGTVTSVGVSSSGTYSAALTVGSSPVTSSGTITITPNLFGSSAAGVVPSSGGGTTNFLRADGTWAAPSGSGTVTSVAMTVPSFLSITGSPITSSGTLAVTLSGTALPAVNGGTAQTTYTTGDILYASASNTLSKLAIGTTGQILSVSGGVPSWGSSSFNGGTVSNATTFSAATPAVTLSGTAPQMSFTNATSNTILMGANGMGAPTFTTRSAGTKLVLYSALSGSNTDFALGINNSTLWYSIGDTASSHRWYAATTNIATLSGIGKLSLTGDGSTANSDLVVTNNINGITRISVNNSSGLSAGQSDFGATGSATAGGAFFGIVTAGGATDATVTTTSLQSNDFYAFGSGTTQRFGIFTNNARRLTVTAAGSTVLGSGALTTSATDGFLYISGSAGTPSGTPTAVTGRAPIHVDTTNNLLYFYSGSAWRTPAGVTSVGGTGSVNGLTLTGTVTSTGNLTLGGTLSLSSPPAIGNTAPSTGAFTTLTSNGATTFTAGTASTSASTGTVVVTGGMGVSANLSLTTFTETTPSVITANGAASTAIDLATGTVFRITLGTAGAATLTFTASSLTSGRVYSMTLIVTQGANSTTITWPGAVKWAGGTAPTMTATNTKTDIFTFTTPDAGTTWYGFTAGQNF